MKAILSSPVCGEYIHFLVSSMALFSKAKNIVTVMVVVVGSRDYNQWANWFPKNCQSTGLILAQSCFLVLERGRGSRHFWTQNSPSELSSALETWPKWMTSSSQNPVPNSKVLLEYPSPCKSTLFKPEWLFVKLGVSHPHLLTQSQYLYSLCSPNSKYDLAVSPVLDFACSWFVILIRPAFICVCSCCSWWQCGACSPWWLTHSFPFSDPPFYSFL